ncbi:MAG TPA: type VI secretion system ATPase TssH [Stellaceae bacterium]|nr:type VI secretion system ATPase TssH [Stellaceae bacterium]
MIALELKPLLGKLNDYSRRALEAAAGLCVSRTNYEVTIDHFLLVMVEDSDRDIQLILHHFGIEPAVLKRVLQRAVEAMKTGNSGRPVFAPPLIEWIADAWLVATLDLGLAQIRSGALLAAVLAKGQHYADELAPISVEELKKKFHDIVGASKETAAPAEAARNAGASDGAWGEGALGKFTINFTERARQGLIDPVFARDREIRQMVDILGRRRKNNPIAVGEAGVGKTAVVEGLALRIVQNDVPDFLKNVELLSLDMGLLQAGAGVKGEFENRLKGVIDEVKASPKPLILFIDEAHTMIGAGGAAGGSDAANLLKPALARGELRTIAATTWSEYKKYFERDPALARRFQLVKLDEPSVQEGVTIIRGLRDMYERSHGIYIRDDAVVAAAQMSARYISGRQLPDKAVDVLDTACARVKLSLSAKPVAIDDAERRIATLVREREALARDLAADIGGGAARLAEVEAEILETSARQGELVEKWQKEKALVDRLLELRAKLPGSRPKAGDAAPDKETPAPGDAPDEAQIKAEIAALRVQLAEVQGKSPLIFHELTPDTISHVISDWTGVPVGNMVSDEATAVLTLGENLKTRIKGQDEAIAAIDEGIRAAKVGLNNPNAPMGVFLFVGSSGVGKTETATAVADILFGGERFMVSINMSEFQEKHTLSRLVGSPPGYVGYGEGGVLTEAVRQRPYSVVLLDEVEKADLEVMNLFYQVFDKGILSDGEGRVIDFKNTVIFLTSNLATDILTELGTRAKRPTAQEITDAIRPTLSRHFKPALLARMQIVPFFPLLGDALAGIVRLKLDKVGRRLRDSQKMNFSYTDEVVTQIAGRCTEVETGARNIDHIINRTLLPAISTEILGRMAESALTDSIEVGVGAGGAFGYRFFDRDVRAGST